MKPKSLKEISEKRPYYIAVYGAPGMGKTTLATTLPGRTLIIDAESGTASLDSSAEGIDVLSVVEGADGAMLSDAGRLARLEEVMRWLATPEARGRYQNVVLDSLTEVGRFVMAGIEKAVEEKAKADGKKADGYLKWSMYATHMASVVNYFRDLRAYTTVFLALEDRIDDETAGTSQYWPALGGKQARNYLPRVFDGVVRLVLSPDDKAGKERALVCQMTPKTFAKVRVPQTTPLASLEPAHLGQLIAKIRGEQK